ncbi:MAG TPA: hypothetical protein VNM16_12830 [Bacillota bacterium]|nr:hypothetical protein [Bacillota bacterium]
MLGATPPAGWAQGGVAAWSGVEGLEVSLDEALRLAALSKGQWEIRLVMDFPALDRRLRSGVVRKP